MAPEVIPVDGHARYSKPADVFSFGLTILSVAVHRPGERLNHFTGIIIGEIMLQSFFFSKTSYVHEKCVSQNY